MKKFLTTCAATVLAAGFMAGSAMAQSSATLDKIKASGQISLGVRDSSALAYTLGNGKYVGFHTEMAERIVDDLTKQT
ncbi:MAG: amino acid ABC transporter substrate-binding protein, partial [Azonexus sp.]|nr:amino acid ABC transporter substrate-binding protein [Azonexus sp.]